MSAPFKHDLSELTNVEPFAWDHTDPKSMGLMAEAPFTALTRYLNDKSNTVTDLIIYKQSKHDGRYYHISLFEIKRRVDRAIATISASIADVMTAKRKMQVEARFIQNMCKIIAYIQYGHEVSSLDEMYCLSGIKDTGLCVNDLDNDTVECIRMGLTLHHIKYIDGTSEHKENSDVGPSSLLRRLDLTNKDSGKNPQNIKAMNEFLSCVIINAGHHNALHCRYKFGGYETLKGLPIMPFYLQSKDNYDKVCDYLRQFGFDNLMSYDDRIKSLSLNP